MNPALVVLATTAAIMLLARAPHAVAVRRGYTGVRHALAWAVHRHRINRVEQCCRCGGPRVSYVLFDRDDRTRESHCIRCHVPGERFPGFVCLYIGDGFPRTVGEVEDRLYRWFDAADAIAARRTRTSSPVPAPTHELSEAIR